jgi:copper chaperone CopZ
MTPRCPPIIGVDGMACTFCDYDTEKELKAIEGTERLDIRIKKGTVKLRVKKGVGVTPSRIQKAAQKHRSKRQRARRVYLSDGHCS